MKEVQAYFYFLNRTQMIWDICRVLVFFEGLKEGKKEEEKFTRTLCQRGIQS